jgi:regulator of replication initiation timing
MTDRIPEWLIRENTNLQKEIERLRAALHEWDALIQHQYSGSREAMSDMTYAAQRTAHLLYGDEPWPEPRRAALGEASDDAAT